LISRQYESAVNARERPSQGNRVKKDVTNG
jgi:hypothetical protein